MDKRTALALLALFSIAGAANAATFGTAVPVRGTVSDLALDEGRGRLYIANFSAGRIEVMDTSSRTLQSPLQVPFPPSAVALSPGGHYLLVGEYNNIEGASSKGGLTIFNLDDGTKRDVVLADPVLAAAFGAGSQALVITAAQFLLVDPSTGVTIALPAPTPLEGKPLPVPFNTFPPNIIEASTGVSGDGQTIVVLAQIAGGDPKSAAILRFRVGQQQLGIIDIISTPPLGPRSVSVNQDGSKFMTGWTLLSPGPILWADIPYATGDFRFGGHAWDSLRDVLYVDAPVTTTEAPVLHVMDTDNLTVRARIQLPQTISGRTLMSSDMNTMYAASVGGVLVLPVGSLSGNTPRVTALQEDVLFFGDACNRQVISQFLDIVNLGGGPVDFKLSLPDGTTGVRLSQTSGITPARVRIDVDPTVFQNARGTTTISLTVTSAGAVNIPFPVRLLINTRDVNQTGKILNVPGKIVDIIADRFRNRFYMLRQDKNLVLVYDSTTLKQIGQMRTGNTPMTMAITDDQRYMIVGNDRSHLASVFDLETFETQAPILFQDGYPRSIAVAHGGIWATVRVVSPPASVTCTGGPVDNPLYRVDFFSRTANAPPTLGIYCNQVPPTAVLSSTPSENYLLMAMADGTVAMWDAGINTWVVSRTNTGSVAGAFGAFNDNLFVVGNNVLDPGLFPVATLQSTTGSPSGVGLLGQFGLRTTAASASGPGTIEFVNLNTLEPFHGKSVAEAPLLASTLTTPRIGQIGQTILPFTRTMAVSADGTSIFLLTASGVTVVASNFDAPTPIPTVTGIVNGADGGSGIAPGGLALVQGFGLAPRSEAAVSLPLPSTLGDACVTVGNIALPLFRVSPTEVLAQLPFGLTGDVPLVVRNPGGVSNPFTAHIQTFAPAIFRSGQAGDQSGLATVIRQKNADFVNFTNPIHPDDILSIYLTGLSQTSPAAPFGDGAPSDPLAVTATPPTVTLGNSSLDLLFSGLVPGEVAVYVINVLVPHGVAGAVQTPLTIKQGDFSTTLQVRVVNP
ncbi:MAG TPA: hypothetical protein VLN48_17325 [Bryobacteraceae bacterium]|nr:hypothetical protein [Bryobacteraceae bacterium]